MAKPLSVEPYIEEREVTFTSSFDPPGHQQRPSRLHRPGVLLNGDRYVGAANYGDPNGRVVCESKRLAKELRRRVKNFARAEARRMGLELNRQR